MTVSISRKNWLAALGLVVGLAACPQPAPPPVTRPAPPPAAPPPSLPAPAPAAAVAAASESEASGERVLPLGAGETAELVGTAFVRTGKEARRPLHRGERLTSGQRIETGDGDGTRLELRFGDGSVLRLGRSASITLLSDTRQVALHRGRLLVDGDRMLGSLAVLTRFRSFLPEGTTYSVELDVGNSASPRLELVVFDGAVCACPVAETDPKAEKKPRPQPTKNWIVVHGEKLDVKPLPSDTAPQIDSLTERLKGDPLVTGFARRLPAWRRIDDLADQQRRGFLTSRSERLRREIFWKRPARPPIKLPAPLSDPDSVRVEYEYPR